jgi:hypothetical protein
VHINSLPSSGYGLIPGATYALSVGARALLEEQLDFRPRASDLVCVSPRRYATRYTTERLVNGEWTQSEFSEVPEVEATFAFYQGKRRWVVSFSVEKAWEITRAKQDVTSESTTAKPAKPKESKGKIDLSKLIAF